MAIVLVRIDDRLIHGQVIVEWAPFVKATAILIADDEIEHNPYRKEYVEAMKMAVPPDISVGIFTVAEVVKKYLDDTLPKGNVMLLFSKLHDFKKSLELGFTTQEVNLGCLHSGDIEILTNITIKKEEASYLIEFQKNGIHLDLRAIPKSKRVEFRTLSIYQKLIE